MVWDIVASCAAHREAIFERQQLDRQRGKACAEKAERGWLSWLSASPGVHTIVNHRTFRPGTFHNNQGYWNALCLPATPTTYNDDLMPYSQFLFVNEATSE